MNYVEKLFDGVQSYLNVNSATFSGAVDIIVVPQEDGSLATTSWHVRFGKLQLITTSEKKVKVEVNDVPIKGLRMRLGRAGESYFVCATKEPPPPETRVSFDPEHGLSDDELDLADQRGSSEDWTYASEEAMVARSSNDRELDVQHEMRWSMTDLPTVDGGRERVLLENQQSRVGDSNSRQVQGMKTSISAQSVLTNKDLPATTGNTTTTNGEIKLPTPELSRGSSPAPGTQSSLDGSTVSLPELIESSSLDKLLSSDPTTSSTQAVSPPSSSPTPESPAKDKKSKKDKASGKSWGLSLFGFLGKKEQEDKTGEDAEAAPSTEEVAFVAAGISSAPQGTSPTLNGHSSGKLNGVPTATHDARTDTGELDTTSSHSLGGGTRLGRSASFRKDGVDNSSMFGDEIYPSEKRESAIQSSSLPNNWGPSPLMSHGRSNASLKSEDDLRDDRSDGGRSYAGDDDRSRAADDGSGVIHIGSKRKARSSSITSADNGKVSHGEAHGSANTTATATTTTTSISRPENKQTEPKRSQSTERVSRSSAVSSVDSDDDSYQDLVFEMDEEAYHAANASTTDESLTWRTSSRKGLLEMSKCGIAAVAAYETEPNMALEAFNASKVSWQALNEDPSLIFLPDLVFRISGAYYPLSIAAPIVFCQAAFNQPLSGPAIDKMVTQAKSKAQSSSSKLFGRWFGSWTKEGSSSSSGTDKKSEGKGASTSTAATSATSPMLTRSERSNGTSGAKTSTVEEEGSYVIASGVVSPGGLHRPRTMSKQPKRDENVDSASLSVPLSVSASGVATPAPSGAPTTSSTSPVPGTSSSNGAPSANGATTYYVRSLQPTSDQLKSMNLKPGPNKVVFSVTSRLQGVQQVSSTIYLWDRDSKIVISDIDGTITRSDVLGQLFPAFGKDWSHSGVVALFQSIKANGYEILYLTARAIGAAKLTKGFLTTLQQDSTHLPSGPVFMSPDRLLHSLNREVILRRPEQFKIQCLNEIKSIFMGGANGTGSNPFYAGFGNRETDALSYVAVGIPVGKTFTIDPSGEITGHSKSIQRTYTKINELAEQMFPPYHKKKQRKTEQAEQWNDFQYWETRPSSGYSLEDIEKSLL